MNKKRLIKVGVHQGDGPPPGYFCSVLILDFAFEEAMGLLNEDQYQHIAMQVKELATQQDPTHSQTVDVRPIEDFYEIRDKGGILGKLNVRVFFDWDKERRALVILGIIHKQNDGSTPPGDRLRMRHRRNRYRRGELW